MAIQAKPRGFLFEQVPDDQPQRSAFDLSHRSTISADFDYLYPILLEEVIPNSDYELNANIFMRTAPLIAPIFQDVDVKLYHFWVPNRIIFRKWKKLISNGDGSVSIADALAAKKLVDMPFITNYDLAQRGNYSYTDKSGIHMYDAQLYNTDVLGVDHYTLIGSGEGVGSLADYFGIPSTNLFESDKASYSGDFGFLDFKTDPTAAPYNEAYVTPNWSIIRSKTFQSSHITNTTGQASTATDAQQKTFNEDGVYKYIRTYNSLPFRAYNKIWYDWFRDENLMQDTSFQIQPLNFVRYIMGNDGAMHAYIKETGLNYDQYLFDADRDYYNDSSPNSSWDKNLSVGLLRKCYTKDYLTSALPSPQRGADVTLPVSGTATIKSNGDLVLEDGHGSSNMYSNSAGVIQLPHLSDSDELFYKSGLKVDLSNVNSLTIEALRVANKMQQFLEKFARTGSRYVEMMLSHFDTLVPDAASERPTLIGTERIPIQISANSSQNAVEIGGDTIPQGTQVGQAMTSGNTGYRFHCDEHGYLMTLLCIEPRSFYGSSLPRHWQRRGWLDYAWPKFANLGEQPVYMSEVYPDRVTTQAMLTAVGDGSNYDSTFSYQDAVNMQPFAYQSRYSDYKYVQDAIHGDFRNDLSDWTLARFKWLTRGGTPSFNSNFLLLDNHIRQTIFHTIASKPKYMDESNVRIWSGNGYQFTDHFWFDVRFNFKAIKPLPLFGIPTL